MQLTSSYSLLYQANFPPLFRENNNHLTRWTALPLSLIGLLNILKMSILPKLLYLFETLPVAIPMSQLKALQRRSYRFIWNNASHRVVGSVARKNRGGLGAPDFIKYYYASHLRVLTSWTHRKAPNRWAKIEMSITSPVHPCYLLWPSSDKHMPQLRGLCLAPMLYSLSSPCSPLINLFFNPDIPDSLSYDQMLHWTGAGSFQLRHLVNPASRHLLTFTDLQKQHQFPKTCLYAYLQFRHFFTSKAPALSLDKPTNFEILCANGPYEPHLISTIYTILHEVKPLKIDSHHYMKRWSQTLQHDITLLDWENIWESTAKISRCVAHKESTYKILLFWYKTPERLHKYNPTTSNMCWRCNKAVDSHFHFFWECPLVTQFWAQIQKVLEKLMGVSIPLNPMHYILGLPVPGIHKFKRRLMSFVLLAAKRTTPKLWLSTASPTLIQTLTIISDIRRMEHLTAIVEGSSHTFLKIWKSWDDYDYGSETDSSIYVTEVSWGQFIHKLTLNSTTTDYTLSP